MKSFSAPEEDPEEKRRREMERQRAQQELSRSNQDLAYSATVDNRAMYGRPFSLFSMMRR